ncbi:MAG: radical SAM protein [Synergistaceae bacterium]|nr:radical SAM protein [Synergistaceae bacterium]
MMSYSAAYYNWTEFYGHFLLTNDIGKYCFLNQDEFHDFAEGRLSSESEAFDRLQKLGFLYQDQDKYISDFQHSMAGMKQCLLSATHLMILVLTDSCNQRCVYCQAGKAHSSKMSVDTCRKAVDLAVQSPVSRMTIEFQGGEPTLNPEALRFTVSYASKVFAAHGKHVDFAIASNMTNLDPELFRWMIEQDIHISTSLDGDRNTHEYNRPLAVNKSSYDAWHSGIDLYKNLCEDVGKLHVISAIQTSTKNLWIPLKQSLTSI